MEDAVRFVLTMMARLFARVTLVMSWMQMESLAMVSLYICVAIYILLVF